LSQLNTSTKITGYKLSYNTIIEQNNNYKNGYSYYSAYLPFKNLNLNGWAGSTPQYGGYDYAWYNPSWYNIPGMPLNGLSLSKHPSITLMDGNNNLSLGDEQDLWNLKGLEEYYPLNNDYDITKTDNINRMRINFSYILKDSIDQTLKINNISMTPFYTESFNNVWLNGVWYAGTWYIGTWEDGSFYSGMWISGNFKKGLFGGREEIIE